MIKRPAFPHGSATVDQLAARIVQLGGAPNFDPRGLIDRSHAAGKDDPIRRMAAALESGDALIVFPEGTRNTTDARLLPFKSGVYHLAVACPDVEFLPVWIENLSRVMPKGRFFPVPLLCTITIGAPLRLRAHEDKETFVARTRDALLALAPPEA